jgi:hypothetical protein
LIPIKEATTLRNLRDQGIYDADRVAGQHTGVWGWVLFLLMLGPWAWIGLLGIAALFAGALMSIETSFDNENALPSGTYKVSGWHKPARGPGTPRSGAPRSVDVAVTKKGVTFTFTYAGHTAPWGAACQGAVRFADGTVVGPSDDSCLYHGDARLNEAWVRFPNLRQFEQPFSLKLGADVNQNKYVWRNLRLVRSD